MKGGLEKMIMKVMAGLLLIVLGVISFTCGEIENIITAILLLIAGLSVIYPRAKKN